MNTSNLKDLALLFLKLGLTGFGGPAAHIAMMEAEVVQRRRWLSHEQFLDLLSATHLIPGPNSTEMAIHIGYLRSGWRGLCVAGICFILPAMLIVMAMAAVYQSFGTRPEAQGILRGISPVMMAVIAQSVWNLARPLTKAPSALGLALICAAAHLAGVNELLILFAAGVFQALGPQLRRSQSKTMAWFVALSALGFTLAPALPALAETLQSVAFSDLRLFGFFLKVGSVLYGSGYVLVAFLEGGLVRDFGWITSQQLMDAIAIGQITPGPVFTTATFIGYLLSGVRGAILATVAIFLPAFVFVAASSPWLPQLRKSKPLARVLNGLNGASLGLMASVVVHLGAQVVATPVQLALALLSLGALVKFRTNPTWLMLMGALGGWLFAT